ncbi:MAG: hypothetical protein H8E44_05640 [Planctomycetes bacterium]|nr:hypothetical protein [Planctomycetota bacterium]MBL7037009.1 hypothetical protein [Pirellulaceae bacterium]
MQNDSHNGVLAVVGLAVMVLGGTAHAELPPGAYKKLKDEAKEVLQLQVVKVEKVRQDESVQYFICDARVVAVERSAAGHKKGAVIQFETYYVYDRSGGFAGPQSPPRIPVDWKGRVYLNPPVEDDSKVFSLAAYGQSYEKLQQRRRRGLFRRR